MTEGQFPIILFDPECPLCLRFKQGLSLMDKNLVFISVREESTFERFPELSRQECLEKVHLIKDSGEVISGPDVVDYLVERLPGVKKLSWLLDSDQGKKVKNFFYDKVEELRRLTVKNSSCSSCPKE